MLLDAAAQRLRQVMVDHEQHLAERHRRRPEGRQRDRAHQQDGREDRQDALRRHMNSFSFFRSA